MREEKGKVFFIADFSIGRIIFMWLYFLTLISSVSVPVPVPVFFAVHYCGLEST